MAKKTLEKEIEKIVEQAVEETVREELHVPSEKEVLLDLYKTLQDRGIRSIGDLENLIARI